VLENPFQRLLRYDGKVEEPFEIFSDMQLRDGKLLASMQEKAYFTEEVTVAETAPRIPIKIKINLLKDPIGHYLLFRASLAFSPHLKIMTIELFKPVQGVNDFRALLHAQVKIIHYFLDHPHLYGGEREDNLRLRNISTQDYIEIHRHGVLSVLGILYIIFNKCKLAY
jgi:hypothetical protein